MTRRLVEGGESGDLTSLRLGEDFSSSSSFSSQYGGGEVVLGMVSRSVFELSVLVSAMSAVCSGAKRESS